MPNITNFKKSKSELLIISLNRFDKILFKDKLRAKNILFPCTTLKLTIICKLD